MNIDKAWEQQLAKQLKAQQTYVEDNGFTAGVLAALPSESGASSSAKYRGLVAIPPLVVSAAVLLQGQPWLRLRGVWAWLSAGDTLGLLTVGAMVSAGLLVGCGAWLARDMKLL